MKIFNQTVAAMYLWAIVLLSLLAIVSSYTLRVFPTPLIFAVILAPLVDLAFVKFYLKRKLYIPISAIVTGLIIGSVASQTAPLLLIALAVIIGIASKFLIRIKSLNVFNPAAFGLLFALAIFSIGDAWWASTNYSLLGVPIPLAAILIIAAYEARRYVAALSFFIALLLISLLASQISLVNLEVSLLATNYFFAFIMVPEPRTSPIKARAQAAYGAGIAIVYYALISFGVPYATLVALLIANAANTYYRVIGNRLILHTIASTH